MNDKEEFDVEETPETVEMAERLRDLPDLVMPEAVWNRLATALSSEAAPQVAAITAAPSARRRRWLPGAAVAGVAIVATAVILPTMINTGANVADGPKETSAAVSVQPVTLDMVPARYVVSTGTDYNEAALSTQVGGLLTQVGMDSPTKMVAAASTERPAPMAKTGSAPDMTTDMTALHDCLIALAGDHNLPPALVVDRATFKGGPAAVVVFLHNFTKTEQGAAATLDVVVVNPSCTSEDRKDAMRMTFEVSRVAQ